MRGYRVAGVAVIAALFACGACSGGAAHAGGKQSIAPMSFVGRFYDGAAHLVWAEQHGTLHASMDLTHPGPDPSAGLVQEHLDLGVRVEGTTVTFERGSDTPWTGNIDGRDLVLSWAPDGATLITTTFTSGTSGDYQSAASDASHQFSAAQQAVASRESTIAAALGAKQSQAQAARLAAHDAQVAAKRAAHDAEVAAMRAAHDAKVAAMQQQQAAARAKAAAHRHP